MDTLLVLTWNVQFRLWHSQPRVLRPELVAPERDLGARSSVDRRHDRRAELCLRCGISVSSPGFELLADGPQRGSWQLVDLCRFAHRWVPDFYDHAGDIHWWQVGRLPSLWSAARLSNELAETESPRSVAARLIHHAEPSGRQA